MYRHRSSTHMHTHTNTNTRIFYGSHSLSYLWDHFAEDGFLARVGSVVKDEREWRAHYKEYIYTDQTPHVTVLDELRTY